MAMANKTDELQDVSCVKPENQTVLIQQPVAPAAQPQQASTQEQIEALAQFCKELLDKMDIMHKQIDAMQAASVPSVSAPSSSSNQNHVMSRYFGDEEMELLVAWEKYKEIGQQDWTSFMKGKTTEDIQDWNWCMDDLRELSLINEKVRDLEADQPQYPSADLASKIEALQKAVAEIKHRPRGKFMPELVELCLKRTARTLQMWSACISAGKQELILKQQAQARQRDLEYASAAMVAHILGQIRKMQEAIARLVK